MSLANYACWLLALLWMSCGVHAQEPLRYKVRLFWRSVPDVLEIGPVVPFRAQSAPLVELAEGGQLMLRLPVAVSVSADRLRIGRKVAAYTQGLRMAGPLRLRIPGDPWAQFDGAFRLWAEDGELHVEAEIKREDYVRAVLAGEAGGIREPEALKAMAVAIRSYAFAIGPRHLDEDFHFCDTTHCQDLRLAARHPLLDEAVAETHDELLWKDGKPVPAWHHADSGGHTEYARHVWGDDAPSWVRGVDDSFSLHPAPLVWEASVARADLARALTNEGFAMNPSDAISIAERLPTGRARTLSIGSRNLPAATFRFAVGRQLGWNLLRSDWYEVHGDAAKWHFRGRGAGHGVGLSQRGAALMAREGRSYRQILDHYFPGALVGVSASDIPWTVQQAGLLRVLSVNRADIADLAPSFEHAVRRIQDITGLQLRQPVTVRVFPDVDTYRNATGNPGWVAGTTRAGGRGVVEIDMQPLELLRQRNGLNDVLRHELTHAVLIQNAEFRLPLWMQEGIARRIMNMGVNGVEARDTTRRQFQTLAEVDACLSQFDAECYLAARQVADQLVNESVRVYGREVMSGWVRRGPPKDDPVLQRVLQQSGQRGQYE